MARGERAETVNVFGYNVFNRDLATIPIDGEGCRTINTINPDVYGVAVNDPSTREALANSDYLMLDGVYFQLGSLLTRGETIKANQGPFIFDHFMERLEERGGRAFFLGAAPATVEMMKEVTATRYPNIVCDGLSPPFKPEFSAEENAAMVAAVNAFKPDILFIGMTAPKQEKWAYRHADVLDAKLTVAIGAVFDWYSGNRKPLAPIWFKLKLAWLARLVQRPELINRVPMKLLFLWHVLLAVLRIRPSQA